MSYTAQQKTLDSPSVFNYSGASSVAFKGELYVFYSSQAKNGGWYNVFNTDESQWTSYSLQKSGASNMWIADWTTPCAVVWQDAVFVFFNSVGNDGTWWTASSDGRKWNPAQSVSRSMGTTSETFAKWTSPAAAVYQNVLYLVWNNSRNNGMLRYTTWSTPADAFAKPMDVPSRGLSIWTETSAAMTVFNDQLCLFFNGSGQDGTWMTIFSNGKWSQVISVTFPIKGSALNCTSPAVYVSEGGSQLTLFWNGSANDGLWYTNTTDGKTWLPQTSLVSTIGGQSLMNKSSPCATVYRGTPYVFWVDPDSKLRYSRGLTFFVDARNYDSILRALADGYDFTLVIRGADAIQYLKARFPSGKITLTELTASSQLELPNGRSLMMQPSGGGNNGNPPATIIAAFFAGLAAAFAACKGNNAHLSVNGTEMTFTTNPANIANNQQ
jgi:hypothetical protein